MHAQKMRAQSMEPTPLISVLKVPRSQEKLPVIANGGLEKSAEMETIRLNVGGRSAQLAVETVKLRMDSSRLALFCEKNHIERLTECDSYFEQSNEYYFEKSPTIFEYVIDYYITGHLHRPMDVCPIRLRDEFEYWRLPLSCMAACCRLEDPTAKKSHFGSSEQVFMDDDSTIPLFDKVIMGKQRRKAYDFFENPRSSSSAKVLSIVSASFVLVSLCGLILSSMPEFQMDDLTPHIVIQGVEICCMLFFTMEYMCRFLVSPRKWHFVKQPLNIIDCMTILPFFIEEFMRLFGYEHVELRNLRGPMIVVRVLRVLRIARIFKLARYSIGLRAFGETMKKSAAELSMLGCFLLTGIMLFSTAIYFFERDEPNSKFYSIPAAWWWCVATMTTVGYGDLVPVTAGGKVVAATASVCGIIVLAFPISMILDKFAESTGGWKKDDFPPMPMAPVMGNNHNKFKSMRKSKRYVF
ncbi:unnamed protein product [Bursaphelenchus okinawaensis]|uniref:BTB domain-containing protein n=1 Tax=Bursaphelenchus okinawaensis TaxID=465554 RepID=A0A811L461_9BILA|nr:unnamed protein product [Bursaphelenchus okinawaensis]CAG9119145.1 unnamed protein product [Bursaphelenchus okinawaensis]